MLAKASARSSSDPPIVWSNRTIAFRTWSASVKGSLRPFGNANTLSGSRCARSAGHASHKVPIFPKTRAVLIQISAASRHIVKPELAAAIVAWTGSAIDRAESVMRARVISPHQIGNSRWRGLASHSWSAISGSRSGPAS
jgi:hypothetical protein